MLKVVGIPINKLNQNLSQLHGYGGFTVFKMAAVRHLGFVKFKFFNGRRG